MSIVIDPAYWNCKFKDISRGIGTAGKQGIGTEVMRAMVAYARELKKEHRVPVHIPPSQQNDEGLKRIAQLNENGQIKWIYLPFTALKATALPDNVGWCKTLEQVFEHENNAAKFSLRDNQAVLTLTL